MIIAVNRFTDTVTKIKPNAKGNHMMKKIIAIALAAVTVLSFAACTKQNGENGTTTPSAAAKEQAKSALEILEKVWSKYSNDEKFPATGGSEKQMKEDMPGKFDVSDAEALDFELGFPKAQASEIDDAASLMHMLNQNSFSCGVYHVKDSANVEALAGKIKENILHANGCADFPKSSLFCPSAIILCRSSAPPN